MVKKKDTKRKRMFKKQVRKTLGALFLASAIAVAAIPVDNLVAAGENLQVTVSEGDSKIPIIGSTEKIYSTGDGLFQFAYVDPNNSDNKVAVILGYNKGYVSGNTLEIPDEVDPYSRYTENYGDNSGYVAVGKSGNFLYYKEDIIVRYEDKDVTDGEGNTTIEKVPITEPRYYPCYYSQKESKWGDLELNQFYYRPDGTISGSDAPGYQLTTSDFYQRIVGAKVAYIGNQYLESFATGQWKIAGTITEADPSKGIFAENNNISYLKVGKYLEGIGNYAFYNCRTLSSISLSNGLNTIGNWAFANCINIKDINLDLTSNLTKIGDHAFYNCQALTSFVMPIGVSAVGDSAFENCYALTTIKLKGEDYNVSLQELGKYVFRNCRSLSCLEFPETYSANMKISMLEGCSSLKYITLPDSRSTFIDDTNYTLEDFKASVTSEFYFEGVDVSALHTTATEHSFAFRYYKQDIYEIIIADEVGRKTTYRVNSKDELIYFLMDPGIENLVLPDTIGPYKIKVISSNTFQDKCDLKKITIPSSIIEIEANAFKGSHNLQDVIFLEPVNLRSIGENAFQTQHVSLHSKNNCSLSETPKLTFTGPISYDSLPFDYAMNPVHNINYGTQPITYITYYSGWPQNLTVQYNPDIKKNELVNYPIFNDLKTYTTSSYPYITSEYAQAASEAAEKFLDPSKGVLTEYEQEIVDAALNIVLPQGIESIKADLFVVNEVLESTDDKIIKTLTTYSISNIPAESFKGFTTLKKAYIYGDTYSIGDYAFLGCGKLEEVIISSTVNSLGLRPFAGCKSIRSVDFQGSPYYSCESGIIYELTEGSKTSIVQCLESRGSLIGTSTILASELAGVSKIEEEAFMDCDSIGSVDFRSSTIKSVPRSAFEDTDRLYLVYLPNTCRSIDSRAFANSTLGQIQIPRSVVVIEPNAFSTNVNNDSGEYNNITFVCEEDSVAYIYASKYSNIDTSELPVEVIWDVYFRDHDWTILSHQEVLDGKAAVPPEDPTREGYTFTGWAGDSEDYSAIGADTTFIAQYTPIDPDTTKYKVTFIDWDESVIVTRLVSPGDDAEAPVDPVRAGYTFDGWRPKITDIQENTLTYAQYTPRDSIESEHVVRFIDHDDTILYTQRVKDGEDAILPQSPTRTGYTFIKWQPDIKNITKDLDTYARYEKGDGSGSDGDGNGNGDPTSKFYTLTVRNGSGSGSYAAGAQVIIYANDPASGQVFDKWSLEPTATAIASTSVPATVLTMPEAAVTVTANFKTDGSTASSNTSTSNTSTSNTSSTPRNYSSASGNTSNTGVVNNAGNTSNTSLVIDKNGISNTGVASATVNGSSDDFVIKITESASATDAVVKALMYEYGDLTNIKYFPMDISLYDSTGTNKITDTTGLSISITIPIPDSLITYAGNNKAAGVVDEKLDKLSAKFTTISGVSCITFTAEHFSPYAIYVDTANLTAGTVSDDTPSTGDGIHPKWFLSIGLACISMILFMKKDKRNTKKRMVTA